ncbi:MAG: MerR family transcriptional regulator [Alphaproteobacteria bacterium]
MTKSADAFRTISEVSDELGVPQHVLRFWETKFAHVKPLKRGGGRRYYRPADVDVIRGIQTLLYTDGYTIRVQKVFRAQGIRYVAEVGRAGGSRPGLVARLHCKQRQSFQLEPANDIAPTEAAPIRKPCSPSLRAHQAARGRQSRANTAQPG